MHRGSTGGRRRTLTRLVTLLTLLALAAGVLLPVVGADSPYSTISPQSPQGDDIQWLYKLIFYLSLIVFVGVQIAIVYTVLRYRRRHNDERPEQLHGNKTIEIIWTVVPAIVLLAIFIPTVRTIYAHADEAEKGNFTVEVYAKQWWWEIHYADDTGAAAGVVTANEIVVPQGKDVVFKLYSNNVIHSFWVPQLSGKLDVMPGHENKLAITTENLGYYFGQCAEFCGHFRCAHALQGDRPTTGCVRSMGGRLEGRTELRLGRCRPRWRYHQGAPGVRSLPCLPPDRRHERDNCSRRTGRSPADR